MFSAIHVEDMKFKRSQKTPIPFTSFMHNNCIV